MTFQLANDGPERLAKRLVSDWSRESGLKVEENRQRGKFARSQNLLKTLKRRIADDQADYLTRLFGEHFRSSKHSAGETRRVKGAESDRAPVLAEWTQEPMELRRVVKGKKSVAHVRRDGMIKVRGIKGKLFKLPSHAGATCLGRPVNGWSFWRFQQGPGK